MTDRDASDAGNVVAGIEGVPVVAEIGLEPARRSQGGIVAANAGAFVECLPRRLRQPSVLVAEGDVAMNVVADGLDAGHTSCRSRRDRARSSRRGVVVRSSGTTMSDAREKCVPRTMQRRGRGKS